MTDFDPLDHTVDFARGQLHLWCRAVRLQAERVLQGERRLDSQVDALLLLVALRQASRAADLIAEESDDEATSAAVRSALHAFDERVPDVKDLRDVVEHFDDYMRGLGNLSHPRTSMNRRIPSSSAASQFPIFYSWSGERYILHVGLMSVDVGDAAEAARDLEETILGLFFTKAELDEALAAVEPFESTNPAFVGFEFFTMLVSDDAAADRIGRLRELVTPQSLVAWGNFESARREVVEYGITTEPEFLGDRIAYVKLIPGEMAGATQVAGGPLLITDGIFMSLLRGRDGTWFVHQVGPRLPAAEALPILHALGCL